MTGRRQDRSHGEGRLVLSRMPRRDAAPQDAAVDTPHRHEAIQ